MQTTLLSKDSKNIILFAAKYCNLVKIESVFITQEVITGKQDETAVYLVEPGDYSFLEFDTLYIERIASLAPRIKLFESKNKEFDMSVVIKDATNGEKWVSQIILKDGRTEVKFNCGNPARLNRDKMPRAIKENIHYRFEITKDSLDILSRGLSAMGASTMRLYTDEGKVMCDVKDIEGDTLCHQIADSFLTIDTDSEDDFEYQYSFKTMIPLFREALKENPSFDIEITRRGIMKLEVNGLNLYVMREV